MSAQDVDLDELYQGADDVQQQAGDKPEPEAEVPTTGNSLSPEELLQQLRDQLQELRQKFSDASRVPDYVDITAKVKMLCTAARKGAQKQARQQQAAAIHAAAAAAAAEGKDPWEAKMAEASAAVATQHITDEGLAALLPQPDDDVTCLLLHVPPGHSTARLSVFVSRYGPEPAGVYKEDGRGFALVRFGSKEQRTAFAAGFKDRVGSTELVLLLPGDRVPAGSALTLCGKRRRDAASRKGAADRNSRDEQRRDGLGALPQPPRDIRSVVCSWWSRPYNEQLKGKMDSITGCLKQLTTEVDRSYIVPHPKPAWLTAALSSPHKMAAELPGIIRSPQVDGYRNKAEFSVGLDHHEQPLVGFLQGNFVDGHTQIADPSGCPHMSPTSLAYAAAFTAFLRSPDNTLPPWDKRHGTGFWRLLVVREGRDPTFLPLPAIAPTQQQQQDQPTADAAANDSSKDQEQQQQQQRCRQRLGRVADPPVLPPCGLADLPVERWLVRNPLATPFGEAQPADAEGVPLSEVYEGESSAPQPTQVMAMVQINPLAAPDGPAQIKQQLLALEKALRAAALAQGLTLTSLAVQYHSGVANAAPASAPFTAFGEEGPITAGVAQEAAAAAAAAADGADAAASSSSSNVLGFVDALCEMRFRISPTAFYQVNAGGTCLLYHTIGKMAGVGPDSLLLDVCCGTGTIGLTLAKQVSAVVGIDNVQSAIADAEANAALNGITNATFVCEPAEKVMGSVLKEYSAKYSHVVAVVDPPRSGLHKDVLIALLTCPTLKRLVFVSCNTESLVSNAKVLCGRYRPDLHVSKANAHRTKRQRQEAGVKALPHYTPFGPAKVLAFDLFPHTSHVEAVVLFERD